MKKVSLFFLLLLQIVILPQNNFIKQITAGDYDARNPFIYEDEYGFYPKIFFEFHKNGYSNIYSINYNSGTMAFEDTSAITFGTDLNINPSFESNSGLLYQTNKNGNWDIVLIPDSSGILGTPIFLTSSPEEEFSPKFFETTNIFRDSVNVLFKRQDDITFLTYKQNQIMEEIIFQDSQDYHYTGFAGLETEDLGFYGGHYVFAVEESNLFQKRIVRKFKPFNGTWQPKTIVKDNCDCSDLSLQVAGYIVWGLFYQDTVQTQRRLFLIEDAISSTAPQLLDIDYEGNLSSFDMYSLLIVGKEQKKSVLDPEFYMPYTYLLENNGMTRVRINQSDLGYWSMDSLVTVSVANSNLAVGPVGMDNNGLVVYTVWEDSVNGRIHLFGVPTHLQFGSAQDGSYSNDFVLYQNYPNPFNPFTTIEYSLKNDGRVILKVYNVLGEEIRTLVDEIKSAGNYKIDFSAADGSASGGGAYNLPTGVYIYSLYTEESRLSRKMVLMK